LASLGSHLRRIHVQNLIGQFASAEIGTQRNRTSFRPSFDVISIRRPALANVDHRLGVGVVEFAADDVGQEDAVIAGVGVEGRFAFEVAERAGGAGGDDLSLRPGAMV